MKLHPRIILAPNSTLFKSNSLIHFPTRIFSLFPPLWLRITRSSSSVRTEVLRTSMEQQRNPKMAQQQQHEELEEIAQGPFPVEQLQVTNIFEICYSRTRDLHLTSLLDSITLWYQIRVFMNRGSSHLTCAKNQFFISFNYQFIV